MDRCSYFHSRGDPSLPPPFNVVQIATLLNVPRMRGYGGIRNPPKILCHDAGYFHAIEVLLTYFSQDPLQRALNLRCSNRTEEHHLHLRGHEEEIPSGGMDLVVQSIAIQSRNQAPIPRVGLTLQHKNLGYARRFILDQNRADLNNWFHKRLSGSV